MENERKNNFGLANQDLRRGVVLILGGLSKEILLNTFIWKNKKSYPTLSHYPWVHIGLHLLCNQTVSLFILVLLFPVYPF